MNLCSDGMNSGLNFHFDNTILVTIFWRCYSFLHNVSISYLFLLFSVIFFIYKVILYIIQPMIPTPFSPSNIK